MKSVESSAVTAAPEQPKAESIRPKIFAYTAEKAAQLMNKGKSLGRDAFKRFAARFNANDTQVRKTNALDQEIVAVTPPRLAEAEDAIDRIRAVETLSFGEEDTSKRDKIGVVSANETAICEFVDKKTGDRRKAVVKQDLGEGRLTRGLLVTFNRTSGQFEVDPLNGQLDSSLQEFAENLKNPKFQDKIKDLTASFNGKYFHDLDLSGEEITANLGTVMTWDEAKQEFVHDASLDIGKELQPDVAPVFEKLANPEFQSRFSNLLAEHYGVKPEEVGVDQGLSGIRLGLPLGKSAEREWAASRINMLAGFDNVPTTVLRQVGERGALASVQEFVKPESGGKIQQGISRKQFEMMLTTPPEGWEVKMQEIMHQKGGPPPLPKSIMDRKIAERQKRGIAPEPVKSMARVAVMDYLFKSMDRHKDNMIMDTNSFKFHAIDNGASFGLATDPEVANKMEQDPVLAGQRFWTQMRSIPAELMARHKTLTLDQEDWNGIKKFASSLATDKQAEARMRGIFLTVFKHPKIADKEYQKFLERLEDVVAYGRIPEEEFAKGHFATYQANVEFHFPKEEPYQEAA